MNAGSCVEAEFYPKSSAKGILDPLNAMAIHRLHQDGVETAGGDMGQCGQIMPGAAQQLALLACVNTGGRTAKVGIAAQAHLNKNQHILVLADQVDLAETAA